MVDIFERLEKNTGGPIGQYMQLVHGYFAFPKLEGEIGPHMKFRGHDVLNWSLNNYLGLANHPEVRKADAAGAAEFGMDAVGVLYGFGTREELEKCKNIAIIENISELINILE